MISEFGTAVLRITKIPTNCKTELTRYTIAYYTICNWKCLPLLTAYVCKCKLPNW